MELYTNLLKKILGFQILLYMTSIKQYLDEQNTILQVLVSGDP
jgi:hypothetical protein